jgi:hypothetical protein
MSNEDNFIYGLIKTLIERDWNYPENIHTIFSDNFDNNIIYYSKLTNIVYNTSGEMIGYINESGNILFSNSI